MLRSFRQDNSGAHTKIEVSSGENIMSTATAQVFTGVKVCLTQS